MFHPNGPYLFDPFWGFGHPGGFPSVFVGFFLGFLSLGMKTTLISRFVADLG